MQFIKSKWPTIILVLAIIVAVGFLTRGFFIGSFLNEWRQQRLMDELEKPYKTDTYGGKTPEETFNMFLTALKAGDVELASKYLGPGDRERWLESFNKKSESDRVVYAKELSEASKNWQKEFTSDDNVNFLYTVYRDEITISISDGSGGVITKKFPPGNYGGIVSLYFNSITKVWKISQI